MEVVKKILKYLSITLIVLVLAATIAAQLPYVQKMATTKAISMLEDKIDARLEIGNIAFKPFNTLVATDVALIDPQPYCEEARDTILYLGTVKARFSLFGIMRKGHDNVIIKSVSVNRGQMNLVTEKGDHRNNLKRVLRLPADPAPKEDNGKDLLHIGHITVDDFTFRLQNYRSDRRKEHTDGVVDWGELVATELKADASDFRMKGNRFYGTVNRLSGREQSGWSISKLSGSVAAGLGDCIISNIRLEDGSGSDISMDCRLIGRTSDFHRFATNVEMEMNISRSNLSLATLSYFVPIIARDPDTHIALNGSFSGKVNNLSFQSMDLGVESSSIKAKIDGSVKGLSQTKDLEMSTGISGARFSTSDVRKFLSKATSGKVDPEIDKYGKGTTYVAGINANGTLGKYFDFGITLTQSQDGGNAQIKARVENLFDRSDENPMHVQATVSTNRLDLGALSGMDILGKASMSTDLDFTYGSSGKSMTASLNNLNASSIGIKGYEYKDISGKVALLEDDLEVEISCEDPNFDADFSVWSDKYSYSTSLVLRNANLNAMNLDTRDRSEVAFSIYGHMDKGIDQTRGIATISDIQLTNSVGTQYPDDIVITLEKEDDIYDADIASEQFHFTFKGNRKIQDAMFHTYDTRPILSFVMPDSYLESGTELLFSRDSSNNVSADITSHRIAYRNYYIKDIAGKLGGSLSEPSAEISADEISVAGIKLNNNRLAAGISGKTTSVDYSFDNQSEQRTDGSLRLQATSVDNGWAVEIMPSYFNISGDAWSIPASSALINGRDIEVNGFRAINSSQYVYVNGRLSNREEDRMEARIDNLDVAYVNPFLGKDLNLEGRLFADGYLKANLIENSMPEAFLNLIVDGFAIGGNPMGRITAACEYDKKLNQFNIIANERLDGREVLMMSAAMPADTRHINSSISLEKFPLSVAECFIGKVFSNMEGELNGSVNLDRNGERFDISSRGMSLDKASLVVNATGAHYTVDKALLLCNNSGLHIVEGNATDDDGSQGKLSGGVKWNRLKDISLNVHGDYNDFILLDIPVNSEGRPLTGRIKGSGTVDFNGPFGNIVMTLNGYTNNDSYLHVGSFNKTKSQNDGLLTFVDPNHIEEDPYEIILNNYSKKKESRSVFKAKLHLVANPGLTIGMDLGNKSFSSGLECMGNGTVDIDFNAATKEYAIYGDYTLTEGKLEVQASFIVKRHFQIDNGSSIRFGGNIFDSTVDINAHYQTKVSLEALLAQNEGVSNRRAVECGINITNKLSNPSIKFSIDIPDLSPDARNDVESALSTDDKIQKQFLSLLLSNSFLPDEQSGIFNANSLLYSNVSELMANQVNNILGKLNIPLDLGLKYQYTDSGLNLFDVAVSTQLFNNRVIIGGNFGNRQNITSNTGTLFGDIDIQYKVTRNGAFRVMAFSHSADQYSNYLDNGQRNGLGLSLQQEFDSFPVWFRRLFSSKAQKEVFRRMEASGTKNINTIVLDE